MVKFYLRAFERPLRPRADLSHLRGFWWKVIVGTSQRLRSVAHDDKDRQFNHIVGNSPALESVLAEVQRVAPTDSTVLVLGETGTGKELIAHAIHNLSPRCGRPFVKLNCAAIPFDLLGERVVWAREGCLYRGRDAKSRAV